MAPIAYLVAVLALAAFSRRAHADDLDTHLRDAPWAEIAETAKRFVAEEPPDSVWPFQRDKQEALASSPRKVI
jgi:hypothetical protein